MAIKVWDGFDHYNSVVDLLARSGFLQIDSPQTASITFAAGRNGLQKCLHITSSSVQEDYLSFVYQDRNQSAFTGMAVSMPNDSSSHFVWEFWDSVGVENQVSVLFRGDNQTISAFRGNAFVGADTIDGKDGTGSGVLLGMTGNNAYSRASWNFIEMWVKVHPSDGFVKVYVNSVLLLNVTGVNTQKTGNAWWDVNHVGGPGVFTSGPLLIDDLYYGDTTTGPGTFPGNIPLGDCHTVTLFPVGNDSVQFTPLANANWQEVSETAMDSDTSYNYDSTVGHEDRFNVQSLPAGVSLIYGVQVTGAYRKDDAGARFIKQGAKSGSTETYGANWSLGEEIYVYFTDQWILDPNTSANWLVAGVNAMKIAYNIEA